MEVSYSPFDLIDVIKGIPGRLDSGRLDSGPLDAWILDAWSLDAWMLIIWILNFWTTGRLESTCDSLRFTLIL